MLHRERVIAALEAKAERFTGYQVSVGDARRAYEEALEDVAGIPSPGGQPTVEHDQY
jgi:hypothetical protein